MTGGGGGGGGEREVLTRGCSKQKSLWRASAMRAIALCARDKGGRVCWAAITDAVIAPDGETAAEDQEKADFTYHHGSRVSSTEGDTVQRTASV